MLRRRKKEPRASDGAVFTVSPVAGGFMVAGHSADVERFVGEITKVGGPSSTVRRRALDMAALASSSGSIGAMSGEYVRLSPGTLANLQQHGAVPAGNGYFSGAIRHANGTITSFADWTPVSLDPMAAFALQQMATTERGGSGFISCDNNDGTAANAQQTRLTAEVDRSRTVRRNVILSYIGTATKIRVWNPADVSAARRLLAELISLLARLRAAVLCGGAVQRAWADFAPPSEHLAVIECQHPSPTNVNTRPGTYDAVVAAWARAGGLP